MITRELQCPHFAILCSNSSTYMPAWLHQNGLKDSKASSHGHLQARNLSSSHLKDDLPYFGLFIYFFIFRLLSKQIAFLNSEGRRRGNTSQRHNSWRRVLPQFCVVIDVEATWHHVGAIDFDANPYRKNGL